MKQIQPSFVSIVGCEGTGHHGVTPIVLQMLGLPLTIPGPTDYERTWVPLMFGNIGYGVMESLSSGNQRAMCANLTALSARRSPSSVLYTSYSFPTDARRDPNMAMYNLTRLHLMLERCGVTRRAVVKYERAEAQRVASRERRFGKDNHVAPLAAVFGNDKSLAARLEEERFDALIDEHMRTLASLGRRAPPT